jgi:enamine deaminase RidA (YjgF/YER057c/UK114 family)
MLKFVNPEGNYAPPGGGYTQTVVVPANARWLVLAGQVGLTPDGTLPKGIEAQAEQCYKNVLACLKGNGMGPEDLVKVTIYLTDNRYIPAYRAARDKIVGTQYKPAATLVVVDGLAAPEMLMEVEAIAAKA